VPLGEVGESLKTAQAILGHSDLETTLNIYTRAIPDSQRRAVERVAVVLFSDVPNRVRPRTRPGGSTELIVLLLVTEKKWRAAQDSNLEPAD